MQGSRIRSKSRKIVSLCGLRLSAIKQVAGGEMSRQKFPCKEYEMWRLERARRLLYTLPPAAFVGDLFFAVRQISSTFAWVLWYHVGK